MEYTKGYIINQSCILIGMAVAASLSDSKQSVKINLDLVKKLLNEFYKSEFSLDKETREGSYKTFRETSLPELSSLLETAVQEKKLDRGVFMPVLEDFFAKAHEYILERESESN